LEIKINLLPVCQVIYLYPSTYEQIVYCQGNEKAGLDPLFDMYGLEEEEEEEDQEDELVVPSVREPTRYPLH
jgi:hypothetical protein